MNKHLIRELLLAVSFMKTRISIPIAVMIISSLIGFFITFQMIGSRTIFTDYDYEGSVVILVSEISPKVEELRGFSVPKEIKVEVVTNDWVQETWGKQYYRSIEKEVEVEEKIYKLLFLIPKEKKLIDNYVKLSGFTAGMLDNTLYVVKEYFDPKKDIAREIIAHELTHAIQSKHFSTPKMDYYDEKQAWSALIEGDAIFTGKQYASWEEKKNRLLIELIHSFFPKVMIAKAQRIDAIFSLKMFPYKYGDEFVETLFNIGGWKKVNRVYSEPPQSTEQIIHPEKYLTGEAPVEIDVTFSIMEGWSLDWNDRMGEYFVYIMLANWLQEDQAKLASDGWGGDNLEYFVNNNEELLLWVLKWDSVQDAWEFFHSLNEVMVKTGGVEIENIKDLTSNKEHSKFWKNSQDYIITIINDDKTIIIASSDYKAILEVFNNT